MLISVILQINIEKYLKEDILMNLFTKIKNYIYENRQFILASTLSAIAIIAVIIIISMVKNSNKDQIASDGQIHSNGEILSSDEDSSDTETLTSANESDETSGLSDLDFVLPEDSTEETETTLPADKYTYLLKVNRVGNCVTVYTKDSNGEFTVPYKAMACSTGKYIGNTPLGTYSTSSRYTWRLMVDGTHSQYATRFNGGILFHSVPCYSPHNDQLEYEEFNKLGSPASLGCVRLTVADAKWIYDNCPYGTKVIVYDDSSAPGPLGKPSVIKIPVDSPNRGWDPTDTSPSNPWNSCSPSITASDITISTGKSVNILSTVSAKDTCGNDISSSVTISGSYDTNVAGTYTLTLNVTDLLGRTATKNITLKVVSTSNTNNNTASNGQIRK